MESISHLLLKFDIRDLEIEQKLILDNIILNPLCNFTKLCNDELLCLNTFEKAYPQIDGHINRQ